ncbi:MAG: cysteine--tRNA ligase [Candidatus Babeliales bacterium]
MLCIKDTLSQQKKTFISQNNDKVRMYVCGITPYSDAHLGHGRVYVSFDIVYRMLRFLGYDVIYCRNITDIDDKLLDRSRTETGSIHAYQMIAERYTKRFHEAVARLGCLSPTYEPKVTDSIPYIVSFIERLVASDKAYIADNGDVYFRIERFISYGALSKQKKEELVAGARIEINAYKENPLDFALWKCDDNELFWQSPWGRGRPGWHIECSAMAAHYLGEHIDIHGGGKDLIFPHHENERAQSESLFGEPFVHYWMHNGLIRVDQTKMSKSLGNFVTLQELFDTYDPMLVRYYFFAHHYRAPLEFSYSHLDTFRKSFDRLYASLYTHNDDPVSMEEMKASPLVKKLVHWLSDDFNTPAMLGELFSSLSQLHIHGRERAIVKQWLTEVIGFLPSEKTNEKKATVMTDEIKALMAAREQARKLKQWELADSLRDKLQALGVTVHDLKAGE